MAKYRQEVEYHLSSTLDAKGFKQLQSEINNAKQKLSEMSKQKLIDDSSLNQASSTIQKWQDALNKSFNSKTGLFDGTQFKKELQSSSLSLQQVQNSFSQAGSEGQKAFNSSIASISQMNTGLKTTSGLADKLFTSIKNNVGWQISTQIVNGIQNAFSDAVDYVKELDDSLTQIMLVTDYSRQEMDDYAKSANEAAKALGTTTTAMTNASLVFAQQGFNLDQSQSLAELSTKLANASQQDTATTSDQITAYMNAYGLSDDMAGLKKALDAWAEVANISAADVGEIAQASQRVASAAATTGVNMDQLNAQIATIESVTREAPEQIGNGLKTLYGRFSDLQMGKTLDDGVDLGTVTKTLQNIGVQVLDGDGKMRGVGDIMEDLMGVWQSIDQTQKAAVAQTLAGKYQLSRFEALMNRSDLYNQYKQGSENSSGTLDEMNEKYIDSLQGRITKIQATWEGFVSDLMNTDALYPWLDAFQSLLDIIKQITDAVGGVGNAVKIVGGVVQRVVRRQTASALAGQITNLQQSRAARNSEADKESILKEYGLQNRDMETEENKPLRDMIQYRLDNGKNMSGEERKDYNQRVMATKDAVNNVLDAEDNYKNIKTQLDEAQAAAKKAEEKLATAQENLKESAQKAEQAAQEYQGLSDAANETSARAQESAAALQKSETQRKAAQNAVDKALTGSVDHQEQQIRQANMQAMGATGGLSSVIRDKDGNVVLHNASALKNSKVDYTSSLIDSGDYVNKIAQQMEAAQAKLNSGSTISWKPQFDFDDLSSSISKVYGEESEQFSKLKEQYDKLMGDFKNGKNGSLVNSTNIKNTDEDFDALISTLKSFSQEMESAAMSSSTLLKNLQALDDATNDYNDKVQQSRADTEAARKANEAVYQNVEQGNQDSEGQQKKIDELESDKQKLSDKVADLEKQLQQAKENEDAAKAASEEQARQNQTVFDEKAMQKRITQVMEFGSAVQTLGQTITTVQNLGSIWSDEDLSEGEKVTQTIENLSTTIPMAASGLYDLYNALNAIKSISSMAAASITGAAGAITVIVSVIAGYLQQQHQLNENARQDAQDAIDSAQSQVDAINQQKSSWNSLYESYKQTGTASDELKSAAKSMAEAVGTSGAKAAAAAGDYDTLAKSINSASDAANQEIVNEAKSNNSPGGANYKSLHPTGAEAWINGSIDEDLSKARSDAFSDLYNSGIKDISKYTPTLDFSNMTDVQKIGAAKDAIAQIDDALKQYGSSAQEVSMDEAKWTKQTEALKAARADYASYLDIDDVKALADQTEKAAQAEVQLSSFQDKLKNAGNDVNSINKVFTDDSTVKAYFDSLSNGADNLDAKYKQLEYEINAVNDEQQKLSLQAEQAGVDLQRKARDSGYKGNTQDLVNQLQNSGLTREQQIKFVGSLDENTTFDNFKQQLEDFKNNPDNAVKLNVDIDEQGLKDAIQKKQDMSSLIEDYQKNGNFTEDEVASLIEENPEYLDYLTQVGDHYELNVNALNDWNSAIKQQTAEIQDAQGIFNGNFFDDFQSKLQANSEMLRNFTDLMSNNNINLDTSKIDTEGQQDALDRFANLTDTVREVSQEVEDGKASVVDYFDAFDDAYKDNNIEDIFRNISDYSEETQQVVMDAAKDLADGLADGLNQANKAVKSGNMNLTDYNKVVRKAASYAEDMQAAMHGLQKQADGTYKALDDNGNVIESLNDEQKDFIATTEDTTEAIKNSVNLDPLNEALTDSYNYLSSIMDDMGNLTVPWDSICNTPEFTSTVQTLASGLQSWLTADSANMDTFAAAMGMTSDQLVGAIGSDAGGLARYMADNEGNFTKTTKAIMQVASGGIGQIAAAAGEGVSALSDLIGSFSGEVTVAPSGVGVDWQDFSFSIFDHDFDIKIPLPHFSVAVTGKATGDSAAAVSKIQDALSGIGSGISTLSSVGGALSNIGLSDWAPNGSADITTPPNSYTNPGGRSNGSSGGSGGGGGRKGGGGGSGSGSKPKSSGGGSGGSGGGGSKGSSYTPKTKDLEEDDVDRYERVNTLLDDAESTLDNIKKDQDRVTGKQLLENMEKQIPILSKQIDLENQKLDIQKQEAQELANQLSSQYGIQFDSEGFISNYQDVHDQLLNNVNSLINQYNATGSESGQEALEDQIDAAKKKLDSFNDAYKRYDDLWGKDINDTIGKIKDLQDAIEDLQIDAFNKSAEAVDNIKDINKTLDELNHNMHRGLNGDDPFDKVADDFSKANEFFDSDKAKQYYDTITAGLQKARDAATTDEGRQFFDTQLSGLQQGYNTSGGQGYLDMALKTAKSLNDEINKYESAGRSDIFGENGKELYDAAKTSLDQLGGLISDYWDTIDDIHEDIKDMIDDVADRMDRRKQSLTDVGDELEHIYNVSEALYGEKAYDNMNAILDRQNLNNEAQIDMLQHQIEIWQNLQKSMDKESDEFKDLDDKIRDATKDINDLIEDSLDKLRSKYENTVDKIVDKWANDPFGGYTDSLDWANTEWEAINDNADYYLDDMNRAYQIDKLRSKYLDLLDGSNDLANQRRITDQMNQQLGYLRDKTNLSQYDVQYAQAQLDILQKQIALEDARNNKNQMKLRRDSQGNYRYVYTANEENTRSAQQDLADSTMDAYNLSKDQNVDTQKNILDTLSTYADRVKEIMKDTEDDSEERARRIAETQEWLNERLGDLGEQLTTSQKNLVDDVIKACDSMVEDNGTDLDEIYNQLINGNDEALGQIDRRLSDSIVAGMGNMDDFKAKTQEMVDDLIDSDAKWQDDVDDLSKNVGQDFKDITKAIGDTDKAMRSLKDTNDTFYASLQDKAGVIQNYEGQMQSLAAAATDADNKFRAANATMQDLGRQLKQKEMENANLSAQVQDYQSRLNGGSGSGGGAGGAGGGGTEGDAFGIAQNIWTYGSWANDPVRRQRIISRYGADTASRAQQIVNEYVRSGRANQLINWDSRKYGYDTGGYTGDWSDNTGQYKNGKFALLHQKEIVLNKTDTSNILDAVNIVRGMVNALKTGLIQQTVNDTANAVSNVTNVDNGSTITQDVHITAEFPNANNADEIESALLSLNDRSLQYSFKNFGTN